MANVPLRDCHGRPLDDFDILKCRIAMQDLSVSGSYSIVSLDGHPICGFVANKGGAPDRFVHRQFSAMPMKGTP